MAGFYNCLIFWNECTSQFKFDLLEWEDVTGACHSYATAGFINCFPYISYTGMTFVYSLYCGCGLCW